MRSSSFPPRRFAIATILAIGFFSLCWSKTPAVETDSTDSTDAALAAALESIQAADLQTHVDYLADDRLEGREAGSPGGHAAGDYLAEQLRQLGLKAAGDDGRFFQPFEPNFRNVLGCLEGSDPQLRDEFILIGAHYDHIGYGAKGSLGGRGEIHNGADDNASGTAGVLEMAEAFCTLPDPPRRSILFVFWDAEEKPLLGSKHWVAHPTTPIDKVVFAINVDMIGRLREDKLTLFGSRSGYGLRRLVSRNNDSALVIDFTWTMFANSDHHPFFQRGVPVLFLHTGPHADYHRPTDDAQLLNGPGMRRSARLGFRVAHELANQDPITGFRAASRGESPKTQKELLARQSGGPLRFGAAWGTDQPDSAGVRLETVRDGSPAKRAGIVPGDEIMEFAGRPIRSSDDLMAAVALAVNPAVVVVRRENEDEPLSLQVELAGRPLRWGIRWRTDDAAPGAVILTRVTPGTPAGLAGLEVGDRIYRVNGRDFTDENQFADRLRELEGSVELLVERHGQLRTFTVQLEPAA